MVLFHSQTRRHMIKPFYKTCFIFFSGKLVPFIENTIANASVLTILAISIERYRVVCQPLKGIQEDFCKVAKILVAIWIISSASSIPWFSIAVYRSSELMDGTPIMVSVVYINAIMSQQSA